MVRTEEGSSISSASPVREAESGEPEVGENVEGVGRVSRGLALGRLQPVDDPPEAPLARADRIADGTVDRVLPGRRWIGK